MDSPVIHPVGTAAGLGTGVFAGVILLGACMALGSEVDSAYGVHRVGNGPPAGVTYTAPARLESGHRSVGELESLGLQVSGVESIRLQSSVDLLVGVDWRRFQFGGSAVGWVPDTLQSAAVVAGFDARIGDRWNLRLEVFPGVFSDFEGVSGTDVNVPFFVEFTYSVRDNLRVGGQVLVDPWRDPPVLGAVGVSWKFAERWLLSLWIPRPQIEYAIGADWTAFAGASLSGGTYRLESGGILDYREIRAGAGIRWRPGERLTVEAAAGGSLERQFRFRDSDTDLSAGVAPYVQISGGLNF